MAYSVATQALATALSDAANAYATAAYAAASTNTVDPSLQTLLNAVSTALAEVETALQADPASLASVAQVYESLALAEVTYAACLDLADEVALATSGSYLYVVPGNTSIAVLAGQQYGQAALSVIDQILTLNSIPDPTNIPSGTRLLMPPRPTGPVPVIPGF